MRWYVIVVAAALICAYFFARPRLVTVYALEVTAASGVRILPAAGAKTYTFEKPCEDEAAEDNVAWKQAGGPRVTYYCKPSMRLVWRP